MSVELVSFGILMQPLMVLFSTCIVIFRTKTKILIGADSKRTLYKQLRDGSMTTEFVNDYKKIHNVKNFYFAISGLYDDEQLNLATELCNSHESIKEIASLFRKSMKLVLQEKIDGLRHHNWFKDWFNDRFSNGHIGGISFFCMEGDVPQLMSIYFDIKSKAEQKTKIVTREHLNSIVTILGRRTGIEDPSDNIKKQILKTSDDVNLNQIKTMINLQKHFHPDFVGEPIKFLILDKNSETWF